MRGLDVENLIDSVAFTSCRALRSCALRSAKGGGQQSCGVGQAGDDAITSDEVGGDDVQIVRLSSLVEAVLAGLGDKLIGEVLCSGSGLLALEGGDDRVVHLGERLGVRRLLRHCLD